MVIVDIHAYLRKGINLLRCAGSEPIIKDNKPRTAASIAASTKRSFQLYFMKAPNYLLNFYWLKYIFNILNKSSMND